MCAMNTGVIQIRLNDLLEKKQRTLYWLAKNSGVPYVTLWSMQKKDTQDSIRLPVLSRICTALECLPGDLLFYVPDAEDKAVASLIKSQAKKKKQGKQ